jgi:hypothetical protein
MRCRHVSIELLHLTMRAINPLQRPQPPPRLARTAARALMWQEPEA